MPKLDLDAEQKTNDERRELKDAATFGPWLYGFADGSGKIGNDEGGCITSGDMNTPVYEVIVFGDDSDGCSTGLRYAADANFIVAARNDDVEDTVDKLIAECRAGRDLISEYRRDGYDAIRQRDLERAYDSAT